MIINVVIIFWIQILFTTEQHIFPDFNSLVALKRWFMYFRKGQMVTVKLFASLEVNIEAVVFKKKKNSV